MGNLANTSEWICAVELKEIKNAGGSWWAIALRLAIGAAFLCGMALLFSTPWSAKDYGWALALIFFGPYVYKAWESIKVAVRLDHERQVRIEVKIDALLRSANANDWD